MTDNSKNKVQNLAYTIAGGVIVGIILLVAQSFTSNTNYKSFEHKPIDELFELMQGSFNSEKQATEDPSYYNITSEEVLLRPKLSWKITDTLTSSFGANYMSGPTETLFSYSSGIMNGAFVEFKVSF